MDADPFNAEHAFWNIRTLHEAGLMSGHEARRALRWILPPNILDDEGHSSGDNPGGREREANSPG